MGEWGWFAVAAGGMTAVLFLIFLLAFRKSVGSAAGSNLTGPMSSPNLLLGDMTEALSRGMPGEQRDREEILPELTRAGVYAPSALAEYRALRTVLILTPLFAAAAACLLVEPQQIPYIAMGGLVVGTLGYSLPRLYVSIKAQNRSREIERGLPVFADMVSIALLAGQGLLSALSRVTEQLREAFPKMAEELGIVIHQTELYSLSLAFDQWANRSQLTEVRNLALILTQAQALGNDISTALMQYATSLRSNVRQRAEAKSQRASFWMLFPTIFCLWIPAAVILVGPIYYEFARRRQEAKDAIPTIEPNTPLGKALGLPPVVK